MNMEENRDEGRDSFKVNKLTFWKSLTGILGVLFVLAFFNVVDLGENSGPTGAAVVAPDTQIPTAPLEKQDVKYDGAPILGEEDAPVTMVEFSDFQCPYCARFFEQTFPQLKENYIKTGKVKLAFRHLPLSFHQYAQKTAEASECANEQGKFWEYHDLLFDNQPNFSRDDLVAYARQLELNIDGENGFAACLDARAKTDVVRADMRAGDERGVQGTPTFFLNGEPVADWSNLKDIIQAKLIGG